MKQKYWSLNDDLIKDCAFLMRGKHLNSYEFRQNIQRTILESMGRKWTAAALGATFQI